MLKIHIVLANDFSEIDGQLMLSSPTPDLTAITLYEMKAALEKFGVTCTWEPQSPAPSMTAKLHGEVSWEVIQEKILELPLLFTDRIPESKVTISVTPTQIHLDIHLSDEAVASVYQHGAPLIV